MIQEIKTDKFVEKAKKIHGDTYLYNETIYINSHSKVLITCRQHGLFNQMPSNHLLGKGCQKCGRIKNNKGITLNANMKKSDFSHVVIPDGCALIPLTKGKYTLIDIEDLIKVKDYTWHASFRRIWYAEAWINKTTAKLHRLIMGVIDPLIEVDHVDHNGLNNRKSNLRISTHKQNLMNQNKQKGTSSIYKGVCWVKSKNKWCAYIKTNQKRQHLGYFLSEIEAAKAYDKKAQELFGEFSCLNFPEITEPFKKYDNENTRTDN